MTEERERERERERAVTMIMMLFQSVVCVWDVTCRAVCEKEHAKREERACVCVCVRASRTQLCTAIHLVRRMHD